MATLEDLRIKRREYIKLKAQEIVDEMVRRGVSTDTDSTCDAPNWDSEKHNAMREICTELRDVHGISSTSKVNWGVTDWVFTLNV